MALIDTDPEIFPIGGRVESPADKIARTVERIEAVYGDRAYGVLTRWERTGELPEGFEMQEE